MIKNGNELAAAAVHVAKNHKTIYGLGCFGWPMNEANRKRAIAAYDFNAKQARKKKLEAADGETFAFDCVGLIKALLWGFSGNSSKSYGGAVYTANNVPDVNADQMIDLCTHVSSDFSGIEAGEVVWNEGHIGIYVGEGQAVECTHRWSDGVQITDVFNLGKTGADKGRSWTKHGRLPWLQYGKSYQLTLPQLSRGAKGDTVKALQRLLIGAGFSCGSWGADGSFGPATTAAVKDFQSAAGLEADGIAGAKTMAALLGVDAT